MPARKNYDYLINKRFGRLIVKEIMPRILYKRPTCIVQCDCGNKKEVNISALLSNITNSCGCLHKEILGNMMRTHGLSQIAKKDYMYNIWVAMRQRCSNPKNQDYHNYGGKGIRVCDEWKNDFKSFYDWSLLNGYHKGLSIERIDFNKNYCPENCTWIKMSEQGKNTSKIFYITMHNETKSLSDWCRQYKIPLETVRTRFYKQGVSWEEAFTMLSKKNQKVIQYDLNHNFIKMWNDAKEVNKDLHLNIVKIRESCHYKKEYKGYLWEYQEREKRYE